MKATCYAAVIALELGVGCGKKATLMRRSMNFLWRLLIWLERRMPRKPQNIWLSSILVGGSYGY